MNKLSDAVIYSKKYAINFKQDLSKVNIEVLFKQLFEQISRPLSHNGIILGHIKLIVSISKEEFMFLSVTRLDSVDAKFSSQWQRDSSVTASNINLDINVLIYGYKREMIEQKLEDALSNCIATLSRVVLCSELK